ncbi:hypothetical protein J2X16_001304 [Pelomonas aquatica]|uniref:DUF4382 domain-containing protein n=1 Tax=Pelomonas aquatica TaxID=431058 RepID=A0ABU1Z7K8_9BURK|nr:DUF4382 domain-containing protein [Pelomonas aquatica]MDR7295965.1 hypothetical protein [Pelomonas aquatica]
MSRTSHRAALHFGVPALVAAALTACGGGGGDPGVPINTMGTLRVSLTDAPACGFDHVYVTVEKVRVHSNASAESNDAGWTDITLATPQRIDLLSLSNGAMTTLGQAQLPAGTYQQLRLVLLANTAANPLANSVVVTGGGEQAVDTPSAMQSGLKLNAGMTVESSKVADFAIDFDACKSFVRAGNSGKVLLKPVLALIPLISDAGQRVTGYVDPALANGGATVSVQAAGVPVRATPTDATGKFVLYPVPAGTYDLVVTANGRANAVVTSVPVTTTAYTNIGSDAVRLVPPASPASALVSGTVKLAGSTANTEGSVRALQTLTGGPTVEVGYANADSVSGAYSVRLPLAAPVATPYVANATAFAWTGVPADAAKYRFEARAVGATPKTQDLTLTGDALLDFSF